MGREIMNNQIEARFYSEALGRYMHFAALIPGLSKPPYSVIYLLHGRGDDHKQWVQATSIATRELGDHMIVFPNGESGRYVNSEVGNYEDYIVKDLVPLIDTWFPTHAHRTSRSIGGFSMGGFGAMMLGLKHYDLFSAISAHSASYDHPNWKFRERPWYGADPPNHPVVRACGEAENDCRALARRAHNSGSELAISMDCGTEDERLVSSYALSACLDEIGLKHQMIEYPGKHDWSYVESCVARDLSFLTSSRDI